MGQPALRVNCAPRTWTLLGRIVFLLTRPPTIAHFLNIPSINKRSQHFNHSRSDARQPVGSWSNKGGISWITRCPRNFGQDTNPNPEVMTPSRLERSLCIPLAPKTPMCMQPLNFGWTGQPVRENKARTTVPTLDSQPVRMAQRRHLMHRNHASRSTR
jgi:hypothetical protein